VDHVNLVKVLLLVQDQVLVQDLVLDLDLHHLSVKNVLKEHI